MNFQDLQIDENYPGPYYEGDAPEVGYPGTPAPRIVFHYYPAVEGTKDPEIEVEEETEDVAIGDSIDWADDEGLREAAKAVLTHFLGKKPTSDETTAVAELIDADAEKHDVWTLTPDAIYDVL